MGRGGRRYAAFLGLAVVAVAALMGVGFVPTRRLAGESGLPAMLTGCLIGLASAALAGWPLVAGRETTPDARLKRALLAMFVRLGVVGMLGAAAALSGRVATTPLLFWLATSYVVLLPLEVKLAIASD